MGIGPNNDPETWFDFRKQFDEAVQVVSRDRYATLEDYASRLAKHAQRALIEKCSSDRIIFDDAPCENPVLAYVFIDGFF